MPIGFTSDSPTYKLFRGATNYAWNNSSQVSDIGGTGGVGDLPFYTQFRESPYSSFLNATDSLSNQFFSASIGIDAEAKATVLENTSGLFDYINCYSTIGIKRPEIYETGVRLNDILPAVDSASLNGSYLRLPTILGKYLTKEEDGGDDTNNSIDFWATQFNSRVVTSWEWDESPDGVLDRLRDFFLAQEKYPELFSIDGVDKGISGSNMSVSNTRFLHVNTNDHNGNINWKTLGNEATTYDRYANSSDSVTLTDRNTIGPYAQYHSLYGKVSKPLYIYLDDSRKNTASGGNEGIVNVYANRTVNLGTLETLYYGFAMKATVNLSGVGEKTYVSFPLRPLLSNNILKEDTITNVAANLIGGATEEDGVIGYGGWGYLWNFVGIDGSAAPAGSPAYQYKSEYNVSLSSASNASSLLNMGLVNKPDGVTSVKNPPNNLGDFGVGHQFYQARIGYDVHSTGYGNAFCVPYNGFTLSGGARLAASASYGDSFISASYDTVTNDQVIKIASNGVEALPPNYLPGSMPVNAHSASFAPDDPWKRNWGGPQGWLLNKMTMPTYFNYTPYLTHTYIGADNPVLTFNSTENRFGLARLHKAELIGAFPTYRTPEGNEQDIVYKINKKPTGVNFNPSLMPYPQINNTILLPGQTAIPGPEGSSASSVLISDKPAVIEGESIFDATCGIFIEDFGPKTRRQWNKSLWGILGFSYDQFNPVRDTVSQQTRVLEGGNQGLKQITTNALITLNQEVNWNTNIWGNPLYTGQMNYDNVYLVIGGGDKFGAASASDGNDYFANDNTVVESASSVVILAQNLPKKTLRPYFVIRSDLVGTSSLISSGNTGQPMPVVAIIDKVSDSGDFFYLSGGGQFQFTVTKPTFLSSIKTFITDPDGTAARVNDDSAIIYKVTRPRRANLQIGTELLNNINGSLQQQLVPITEQIKLLQQQLQSSGEGGRTAARAQESIQKLIQQRNMIINQLPPIYRKLAEAAGDESLSSENVMGQYYNNQFATQDPEFTGVYQPPVAPIPGQADPTSGETPEQLQEEELTTEGVFAALMDPIGSFVNLGGPPRPNIQETIDGVDEHEDWAGEHTQRAEEQRAGEFSNDTERIKSQLRESLGREPRGEEVLHMLRIEMAGLQGRIDFENLSSDPQLLAEERREEAVHSALIHGIGVEPASRAREISERDPALHAGAKIQETEQRIKEGLGPPAQEREPEPMEEETEEGAGTGLSWDD